MIHPPSSSVRKSLSSTFKKNDEPSPSSQTTKERLQSTPSIINAPTTEERLKSELSTEERLMDEADKQEGGYKNGSQNSDEKLQTSILNATPVARGDTDDVFSGNFSQMDTDQNGLVDANELLAGQEQGLVGYGGTTGTQEQYEEMLGSVGRQNGLSETEFVNNKPYFAPVSQERKDFEYKYAWLQENRPDMASVPDETLRALAGIGIINEDGSVSFDGNGFYGEVGDLGNDKEYAEGLNEIASNAEFELSFFLSDVEGQTWISYNSLIPGYENDDETTMLSASEATEIVADLRAEADAAMGFAVQNAENKAALDAEGLVQVSPWEINHTLGANEKSIAYPEGVFYHEKYGFIRHKDNYNGRKPGWAEQAFSVGLGVAATAMTGGAASPILSAAVGGFTTGTSMGLVNGMDLDDALTNGAVGAATSGLGQFAAPQLAGLLDIDSTVGIGLVQGGVESGIGTALSGGTMDDFGESLVTNSAGVLGASAGNYVSGGLIDAGVNPAIAAGAGQATGTIVADGIDGGIEDLDDTLQTATANGLGATANVAVTNSMMANGADLPDAQSAGNATGAVVTGAVAGDEVPDIAVAALGGAARPQTQAQEAESAAAPEEDPGYFAPGEIADTTITDEDVTLINDENSEDQPPSVFNSRPENNGESPEAETYPADLPTPSTPEPLAANEAAIGSHPQQGSLEGAFEQGYGGYTVQDGNTLSSISQQTGIPVPDLIAANPQISDPDLIRPGDVVNVPLPGSSSSQINQPNLPVENNNSLTEGNTTTDTAWTESSTLFDGSDMDGGTTYTDGTIMQFNSATGEWTPMDFGNSQTHSEQLSTVLGLLSLSGIVFPPASLLAAGTGIVYAAMDDDLSIGTFVSAGNNVLGVTSAMYNPIANTITLVSEGGSFLIWSGADGVGQKPDPELQVDGP